MSAIYFLAIGITAVFLILIALRAIEGWRAMRDLKARQPPTGENSRNDPEA